MALRGPFARKDVEDGVRFVKIQSVYHLSLLSARFFSHRGFLPTNLEPLLIDSVCFVSISVISTGNELQRLVSTFEIILIANLPHIPVHAAYYILCVFREYKLKYFTNLRMNDKPALAHILDPIDRTVLIEAFIRR